MTWSKDEEKEYMREYHKKYVLRPGVKERMLETQRNRRAKESTKEREKELNRKYHKTRYSDPVKRQRTLEAVKKYSKTDKAKAVRNAYLRNRKKEDLDFWMVCKFRVITRKLVEGRTGGAEQLIGCTVGFFKNHLESLFKSGMSWENRSKWHIDHVIPLKWFEGLLHDTEWQKIAFHWTNMQPLWASENMSKKARYAG